MKKILAIISIVTGATLAFGQGTIVVTSLNATYAMYTNTAVGTAFGGTGTGGVSGKTSTAGANTTTGAGFYYQLLIQPYTGLGVVDNPNPANGWYAATMVGSIITNGTALAGSITAPGGTTTAGATVNNWGAPTGGSASAGGTEMYYMLVGWSASLGNSWLTVSNDIVNNSWSSTSYLVGWSAVGYGFSGGGANNVPAPSVFGVTAAEPGAFTSGFSLFAVPEPTTMALVGLGGLSLLLFRRRK